MAELSPPGRARRHILDPYEGVRWPPSRLIQGHPATNMWIQNSSNKDGSVGEYPLQVTPRSPSF
ncbi:hypothetical protein O5D80_008624 [Batrachochytrium dendrobatidis]|nr:hypothetical protein O5D80_008624 [Batrachochytrium dendrobatidis]